LIYRKRKENPLKYKIINERWIRNNPERYKFLCKKKNLKRCAKINKIIHSFTYDEWIVKRNATNGICPSCNIFVGTDKLTLDHIFPVSKAEKRRIYTINDVQPLCKICNCVKNSKIPEEMSHQITSPMR
jgi:5-methylcytosine-specific restriction endonuclease McrA